MHPVLTFICLALQDHSPCSPTRQEYSRDRGTGQQVCGERQEAPKWQRHSMDENMMDKNYVISFLKPYRNSALIMPGPKTIHEVKRESSYFKKGTHTVS